MSNNFNSKPQEITQEIFAQKDDHEETSDTKHVEIKDHESSHGLIDLLDELQSQGSLLSWKITGKGENVNVKVTWKCEGDKLDLFNKIISDPSADSITENSNEIEQRSDLLIKSINPVKNSSPSLENREPEKYGKKMIKTSTINDEPVKEIKKHVEPSTSIRQPPHDLDKDVKKLIKSSFDDRLNHKNHESLDSMEEHEEKNIDETLSDQFIGEISEEDFSKPKRRMNTTMPKYPTPKNKVIRTRPKPEPSTKKTRKLMDKQSDTNSEDEIIFEQDLSKQFDDANEILPRDSDKNRLVPDPNINDPIFLVRPKDRLSVRFGEPIRFSCQVKGSRPIKVFWLKMSGEQLVNSEKYKIYKEDGFHYLNIYNTCYDDEGVYLCVVANRFAQNYDSFCLDIIGNLHTCFIVNVAQRVLCSRRKQRVKSSILNRMKIFSLSNVKRQKTLKNIKNRHRTSKNIMSDALSVW